MYSSTKRNRYPLGFRLGLVVGFAVGVLRARLGESHGGAWEKVGGAWERCCGLG